MNHLILRTLAGMTLLAVSAAGMAATVDITASFSPSMDRPENNAFTNTTPQSGYCSSHPQECKNGEFSLDMGMFLTPSKGLSVNDNARDSLYFRLPSTFRNIEMTNNESGTKEPLSFRVSTFSARYNALKNHGVYDWKGVVFFSYPTGGCGYIAPGWGTNLFFEWLWKYPQGNPGCYNITSVDRPEGADKYITGVSRLSFGYEMVAPNPLKMEAGVYTGTLMLNVGPGGDIDFGDNFQASETELRLNFTLSVNHELKLTTTAENQAVSLQPCTPGRVCTEDEGQANWERWMVTRITPQLTGRSNFSLSSSGAFTVYLECEQQSGPDCALRSDKMPSQTVPVQMLLTLPDNIVDNVTSSTVSKRRLQAGHDLTKNVFVTKTFGQNRAGSIDFLVGQKDVDTMLTTRPDTYRGAVTVIFDPKIY
ncbi:hypothetical protein [Yokenella regensburgei]|uniref:hypothetical protein n=1 Tax=Yokenella regensburgei TaxID=158877 RepID=UPI003EDA8CB7